MNTVFRIQCLDKSTAAANIVNQTEQRENAFHSGGYQPRILGTGNHSQHAASVLWNSCWGSVLDEDTQVRHHAACMHGRSPSYLPSTVHVDTVVLVSTAQDQPLSLHFISLIRGNSLCANILCTYMSCFSLTLCHALLKISGKS